MIAIQKKIPFHMPSIGEEEIAEVVDVLRSGWLTAGPRTERFEREFRAYVEAPHALAVNSCTAGLHLALAALNIGPGDEVITTPMTFCATVNTILHVGATPILADIGTDGNLDPESVRSKVTSKTKAVLPVHIGGLSCDMEALHDIAKDHGLFVVEDAAHAVGSWFQGVPIGGLYPQGSASDATCFSFYATKNLTTGEGGMVTTHDENLWARMKTLCLHGIDRDAWNRYSDRGKWFYNVNEAGFKYNLSDIQSAIGIHQLRKQEDFIETRTRYAERYNEAFSSMPELEIPPTAGDRRHCWHLYVLRLNLDRLDGDRDSFARLLQERGIGVSVHFIPIPMHSAYANHPELSAGHCPKAMGLYRRIVSLPLSPSMTDEDVSAVIEAVKAVVVGMGQPHVFARA